MSPDVMIALGAYRFSLPTAAYQNLQRRTEYRWPRQKRLQRRPALQFVGPGFETVTLEGVIHPHFKGGLGQVEAMRGEAGRGEPLEMVDGLGFIHGRWVILSIEEGQRAFFKDGAPRAMTFTVELEKYGEDG